MATTQTSINTTLPDRAGLSVIVPGLPPIPWFYRAAIAPAQVRSWVPPVLYSYLPPVWRFNK